MTRRCGQCTLCCKLVPVSEIDQPANQRCVHQRSFKGCAIYANRPTTCRLWSCVWLTGDDPALSRPDLVHYVIDPMPDFVTAKPDDGTAPMRFGVIQVWCDPKHPEAWRDPALLAYIDRRGAEEGFGAIIRYDSARAFAVFPPSVTGKGWIENRGTSVVDREHSAAEIAAVLSDVTGETYGVGQRQA
jgi:hypothetical protein